MAEEKTNNLSTTVRANVIINLLRTLTMTVISFLTFPYVTRALGDQAFGLYTWANTFVYYFLILARISVPNLAIREVAKAKNDPEKFNRLVQEFFLIQAVMTLLSFALLFLLASTVPSLQENNGLIFVLSMNFLVGVFSFEWVYIALEKHIYITVRSLLTLAFGAVLTFIFIKPLGTYVDGHGVVVNQALNEVHIYALIAISGTILTVIINLILLPKYISFKKTGPYDFKALLKPLTVLFFLSLALTLYNQTDVFVLGYIDPTKAAVGA